MIRSPIKVLSSEATVAELIDHSTKSWKRDLVQEIFEEEEASVILQTPISSLNSKDKLIWHGTQNGSFLVKSAYHMEKAKEMEGRGQASTKEENILHTLWNCEAAKDVWGQCSMRLQKSTCSQLPIMLFFENMIKALNDSKLQEFVMVARQLWLRRNVFIFKNKFLPPNCLLRETITMRHKKMQLLNPLLTKSYETLVAVQFAKDLGLTQIELEGDSLQETKALQEENEAWSSTSMFIYETRIWLKTFAMWRVSHVRGNGNNIAHLLAKGSLNISDVFNVTMEDIPQCISPLVQ
ncbi:hypothetical protein I3843_01G071600 [Carya illinoinensis]|nr:hypothetical protein I3843_01G071600 [Carya illinoinensis]